MQFLARFLTLNPGVELTRAQMERFCELYTDLNNHSHLWQNFGWRPDELSERAMFERRLKELGNSPSKK